MARLLRFLKFRSMYVDNDCDVHKEFVMRLIASHPSQRAKRERAKRLQAHQRQENYPYGKNTPAHKP